MTDAHGPLVPAEVDLRGLEWMPYYGDRLARSEFNARSDDATWRAAHNLWWAAWNSVPAGSLPDDEVALTRFADLGRDVKAFRRLKDGALHGFVRCSDGRLYHPFLAQLVTEAWSRRVRERDRKARWRQGRERSGDGDNAPDTTGQERGHGDPSPSRERMTGQERTGPDRTGQEKDQEGGRAARDPDGALFHIEPDHDRIAGQAVDAWNAMADRLGLARVQKLTEQRRAKLRKRLDEAGGIDGWKIALEKLEACAWMHNGRARGGWKADFDFLLQQSRFVKLMEGGYDGGSGEADEFRNGFAAIGAEVEQAARSGNLGQPEHDAGPRE